MTHQDEPEQMKQEVLDIISSLIQILQQIVPLTDQITTAAGGRLLSDYQARVKLNTLRRQHGDLARLRTYLNTLLEKRGESLVDMQGQPLNLSSSNAFLLWGTVTGELMEGFRQWMFENSYSFETIRDSLSTVKIYCELASQAGILPADELIRIREVKGYRKSQAQEREQDRRGYKKAAKTPLTTEQQQRLFQVPDRSKPQGWRDLFLLLLLYEQGIKPSELVTARLADLDLQRGLLRIYHDGSEERWVKLSQDTKEAASHYLDLRKDKKPEAPLLVTTRRSGQFVERVAEPPAEENQRETTPGISFRKLSARVHTLGLHIGIDI